MRFNHLDIPHTWRHEWTKYPEGYTILESLIRWVNQVNDMVGNLNDINERLDEFISQFDEELQETVIELLEIWKDNGIFNDLIESAVFGEFKERLDGFAISPLSYDGDVQATIIAAKENNYAISLGTIYPITSSLHDLHDIKLVGNGGLERDGVTFYAAPNDEQTNTIYVNSSIGNDSYDGLTPNYPVRTIKKALDIVANYARPVLTGQWVISLAAGTYASARLDEEVLSELPIRIEGEEVGGHPNVPNTYITEGAGVSKVGLLFKGRTNLHIKNIKLIGFNGTTSSAGISISYGCDLLTENVHTDGCYWGISAQMSNFHVPDGIHENNGFLPGASTGNGGAFRSLMLNRHHVGIQNAGTRTNTAIIRNNASGVFAQENSTGHVDWCTIEGNTDGVNLNVNSRANVDGCLLKNNVRAFRRTGGSHGYVSANTVFEGNKANLVGTSGSELTASRAIEGYDFSYTPSEGILKTVYVNEVIQNTNNEPYLTLVLKAPFWKNIVNSIIPMKKLEFTVYGQVINNTGDGGSGTKAMAMRLGGQSVSISMSITEQGTFKYTGTVTFIDENTQFLCIEGNTHLNANKQSMKKLNIDMSVDQELLLEAQTAQPLDSIRIDLVEIRTAGH